MLKRLISYSGTFLAFVLLGLVHLSPAVGAGMPSPSGHGDHGTISCQVACQATPQRQEDKLNSENNEKDDEKDTSLAFNEVELINSGVGLLRETAIWKQSSWVPPDLLLQSGAYSTSL